MQMSRFFAGSTTAQQSSKAPAQQSAGVELASARPGARSACSLAAFQQLASCSPARCAPNAQLRPQPHVRKCFTGCSTMTQRNRAPAQRLRSAQRASRSLPAACQACSADVYAARQLLSSAPAAFQLPASLPCATLPAAYATASHLAAILAVDWPSPSLDCLSFRLGRRRGLASWLPWLLQPPSWLPSRVSRGENLLPLPCW